MNVFKESLLRPLRPIGLQAETTMNFLFVGNPGSGAKLFVWLLHRMIVVDVCRQNNCGAIGVRCHGRDRIPQ